MPRWLLPLAVLLVVLGLIPFALIARARVTTSTEPRFHIIGDMDQQGRLEPQQESPLFGDRRAMRPPVPGAVARGEAGLDVHLLQGRIAEGGAWARALPARVNPDQEAVFQRGRERFELFCAPCHGYSGYGDGPVEARLKLLKTLGKPGTGTWASPANYHTDAIRQQAVGELFNTVTHGKKNMGGYGAQSSPRDRWAIVAYVRAMQKSQRPE